MKLARRVPLPWWAVVLMIRISNGAFTEYIRRCIAGGRFEELPSRKILRGRS